jgi:hypothetical protein
MHPRRLEKHANITLNSALFQIEINETKRSTSYFLGMRGPLSRRFKSAAYTNVRIPRGNSLLHSRACKFYFSAFVRPSRKRLARQFLVAPIESYLPGRGADFGQVLVSTVSR